MKELQIRQAKNGYLVYQKCSDMPLGVELDTFVFNHIEHLYEWMQEYFEDQCEPLVPIQPSITNCHFEQSYDTPKWNQPQDND